MNRLKRNITSEGNPNGNRSIELNMKTNNNKIEENFENSVSQNSTIEDNTKEIINGNNNNENKIIVSVKNEDKEKSTSGSNKSLVRIYLIYS